MNKSLVIPLIVSATAFAGDTLVAVDVFDSPGPGYRQQIERAFGAVVKDGSQDIKFGSPIVRVVPTSFATATLPVPHISTTLLDPGDSTPTLAIPSLLNPFSAPIRLSIDHSVVVPARAEGEHTK